MGGLMSTSLTARLGMSQGFAMTPRLQKAIQCLGMSNLELAEYLDEIVQSNPFVTRSRQSAPPQHNPHGSRQEAWRELADPRDLRPSLHQHLILQLDQAALSATHKALAQYLIGCVNEDGYLRETLPELSKRLGVSIGIIEDVLVELQEFDPPGVMARDLGECLGLQLAHKNLLNEGMRAVLERLNELPGMTQEGFSALYPASEVDLQELRAVLASLNPHPGRQYSEDVRRLDPPDILLGFAPEGGWKLRLNDANLPRPLLDKDYVAHIAREAASLEVKQYVRVQCDEANWLIRAFDQRAQTILAVCQEIIRRQDAHLADERQPLVPLTMAMVAEALDIHESTVSRAVRHKTMETPRGIIELKALFCASVGSLAGKPERSVASVCQLIQREIENETAPSLLTDQIIRDRLRSRGIDICRRTVSKYRLRMGIPSARERNHLASSKRAHCSRLR
jgi:RNA polymerase sigma-54 factor